MNCIDYIPQETSVTTHRITMEEYLNAWRNGLTATSMTINEMREMYDPIHQEVVIQTKSEMVNLDHARFDPCPNCGANDWRAHFRTINQIESKLDHYSCAYCGTRKEK